MAEQNQETIEIMERVNWEMQRYGKITGSTADALRDAQVGVKGFSDALRAAPKSVADAATSMASAVYNGEKGAKAFNKSIDSMASAADAAITVLMAMIPGGILVKAVVGGLGLLAKSLIKGAAEVTKAANEQGDALYDTYQKLGKSGLVAAGGTTQLGKDLFKLGLDVKQADSMISLFSENSQTLAMFGKTAFQGADAFTGIVNAAKPYRETLQRLGLNQVEQNEAVMGYIKLQTRLGNAGRLQAQGYEATAAAANKYIEEQDALTKITGISRKEQEKALEDAMRNARYAATLDALTAEGKHDEVKALQNMVLLAQRQGPQAVKGMQDVISGFAGSTKEGRALLMSSQGEIVQTVADAKNGLLNNDKDLARAYDKVEGRIGNTAESLRSLTQAVGDTGTVLPYAEARQAEILNKQGKTVEASLAESQKQQARQKAGEDPRLKAQSEATVALQDATLATQQLVDKAITPAAEATLLLAVNAKKAAEELLRIANGGKPGEAGSSPTGPSGGGVGSVESKQTQLAVEKRKEAETKVADLQKEREKLEKEKGRADEETKKARIAEMMARREAERKRAEEEHYRRKQGQAAVSGAAGRAGASPTAPSTPSSGSAPAAPVAGGGSASAAEGGEAKKTAQGLKLKGGPGGQATAGGESTEGLYALAHSIQGAIGDNLEYFSGLNDAARANDKNSKHSSGKALDVVLKDKEKYPSVLAMIKGMPGVKFAQFERAGQQNANGSTASGDHIHAEVSAANGAILSGPRSGYQPNLTMHGTEAIVPLPDGKSIPVSNPGMGSSDMQQSFSNAVGDMTGALIDAISEMIREQKNTNSINQKLLQAARN